MTTRSPFDDVGKILDDYVNTARRINAQLRWSRTYPEYTSVSTSTSTSKIVVPPDPSWYDDEPPDTEERPVSRMEDIEARMRALEAELATLKRFGDGTRFVEGDVVRWRKTFAGPTSSAANEIVHKTYTYAALKTDHGWYVTGGVGGQGKKVYTYDELISFITSGPPPEDVEVATSWLDVTRVETMRASDATEMHAETDETPVRIRRQSV